MSMCWPSPVRSRCEPANFEVLYQDVRTPGERPDELLTRRLAQVRHDRALAAVAAVKVDRLELAVAAANERWSPAAGVIAFGSFDLDDIRPEIGERLSNPGAGEDAGELEYTESGQWRTHQAIPRTTSSAPAAQRKSWRSKPPRQANISPVGGSPSSWFGMEIAQPSRKLMTAGLRSTRPLTLK